MCRKWQKLTAAREEAGLSRAELGQKLGLSEAGYGHIESGRRLLGIEYLVQLPRILGKPVTHFLPDEVVGDTERQNALLNPRLREIVEMWPKLHETDQSLLYIFITRFYHASRLPGIVKLLEDL
jgi:transcriptional regulator with XRE-family HTH domain